MARSKATVTLDRGKVADAQALIGAGSMSDVIDVALDRLIHAERLKRDIAAYRQTPPGDDELALAGLPVEFDLDDEAVNYEAIYGPVA